MFYAEYNSKSYFHFRVDKTLPEEGILKGKEGELRFKRIPEGFAVYETTLLGSGFVPLPHSRDFYIPHTINDIPVVELHQTILLEPREASSGLNTFAIEGGNLERAFITVRTKSQEERRKDMERKRDAKDAANGFVDLMFYIFEEQNISNENDLSVEVAIKFFKQTQRVDLCSITCKNKLILRVPSAKEIEVKANKTELRDIVPGCVERLTFSGKVYPFIEADWDGDIPNNQCFSDLKSLRVIEGSLSGDSCWSFRNCTALESVHLSNGMKKVPSYAFSNCSSLKDLYIPDTVTEIGAYAFSDCTNLVSIHLPSTLKIISEGMFRNCKSLKKVYLADTIEIIEDYAFAGCINLQKPWIPKNITHIAETAFPVFD